MKIDSHNNGILCVIILSFLLIISSVSCGVLNGMHSDEAYISPYDFGLKEANSDIERFYVLEKTHRAANQKGVDVSYKGIDTISIEIPVDAGSIAIGNNTDFQGVVICVRNKSKDIRLFSSVAKWKQVSIPKECIDIGWFDDIDVLSKGNYILFVEDEKPWGDNRIGYEYAHKRRDLLLVKNGRSVNKPVMSYNNDHSTPKCYYVELSQEPFCFKNLTVNRTDDCTHKTFVLFLDGYNDVQIENVVVNTPDSELTGDHVLRLHNCSNVSIKDTRINGTYSAQDHSGYGISMNNIWNFRAYKLFGRGKWGVFGSNNINNAVLEKCDINRFDIHCYGRDCYFREVNFVDLGNQFSSVYGSIVFDSCVFTDFTPIVNRSSFNAFVGYELYLNDCVFNLTPKKKYLVNMGDLSNQVNSRPELFKKCWPNIHINNLTVNMTNGAGELVLLASQGEVDYSEPVGYINTIEIKGMIINSDNNIPLKSIVVGTKDVKTENEIECVLSDIKILGQREMTKTVTTPFNEATLKVRLPLKGNSPRMKNVKGIKQAVH